MTTIATATKTDTNTNSLLIPTLTSTTNNTDNNAEHFLKLSCRAVHGQVVRRQLALCIHGVALGRARFGHHHLEPAIQRIHANLADVYVGKGRGGEGRGEGREGGREGGREAGREGGREGGTREGGEGREGEGEGGIVEEKRKDKHAHGERPNLGTSGTQRPVSGMFQL